jgi:hypothetical protein
VYILSARNLCIWKTIPATLGNELEEKPVQGTSASELSGE